MKKLIKKFVKSIPIILSLCVILSCFAFAASASVNITPGMLSAVTSEITASSVKISGHNNESSSNYLYFSAQFKDGGTWHTGDELLISAGNGLSNYLCSPQFNPSVQFRLKLNPYAVWGGCSGWGTIENQ